MIAEFITPDDRRWAAFLSRTLHDFYHLPSYLTFSAAQEGGTPVAFYAEEGDAAFLAPLLLRSLPEPLDAPRDWVDAKSPYGYPTPLLHAPHSSESFLQTFLGRLREAAAGLNVATMFFRLHPLIELDETVASSHGTIVRHGPTVYIDLTQAEEELDRQVRSNHRRGIRKLRDAGFHVSVDDWTRLGEFVAIYNQTMGRVAAADRYFFQESYFHELQSALGGGLHLFSVLSPAGDVASAGVFTVCQGIVQYHLGGTADPYLSQAPSKLMFDSVRRWAHAAGHRVFHLGGGLGAATDSLFLFKAGFSNLTAEFRTFRMTGSEACYARLNETWERLAGRKVDLGPSAFPAYRMPMSIAPDPTADE